MQGVRKMVADRECYDCCIRKAEGLLEQYQVSETIRGRIMEEVEKALQGAGEEPCAPLLMGRMMSVLDMHIDTGAAYGEVKRRYNRFLLEKEKEICRDIADSSDPFLTGLKYAVAGNYIDFGAMSEVKEERLAELLAGYEDLSLNQEEVLHLQEDLSAAQKLVYISDNAGEIVLDKIFIRTMRKLWPSLAVTVIVRGFPILNDATKEDAWYVGVEDIASVLSNGAAIPGTPLDEISREALETIEQADLCIAKGQGNFESLRGCGKNVYYLFLCKCQLFVEKFRVERFKPVLTNEKRIVQYD